ncbi:MAG TPA: alpha/beta fold hydrolase [Polyangiaceae bacterium]|nr:alpha/beta fold hydrolase [Polyangiaceae bacterium]
MEARSSDVRRSLETPNLLVSAGLEAGALARVASLWPRDIGDEAPLASAGDDVAVLVHGALATAGAWRPLRKRLEGAGVRTTAFTYGPGHGVPDIARILARAVEALPAAVRIHLVGHSLGGLAVRWFVQELGGDARVVETIAIAAPFEGARGARLMPGPAGRDMRRGSDVLRALVDSAPCPGLPHLSIFGTLDTAVAASTCFPAGDRLVIPGAGHNRLLFHDDVADAVQGRIERWRVARDASRSA